MWDTTPYQHFLLSCNCPSKLRIHGSGAWTLQHYGCGWKVSSAQWRRNTQRNFIQNHRPQHLPNRKLIDLQSVSQSVTSNFPKILSNSKFQTTFPVSFVYVPFIKFKPHNLNVPENKQQIRVQPVSSLLHRAELPQCQQILKLPWAN